MPTHRKNKDYNPYNCPVTHTMNRIGGKWKVLIIYAISKDCNRFSRLQKVMPLISKQMLVNQLRELEADGILQRIIYPEVPPKVEYRLTDRARDLMPVIAAMQAWGLEDIQTKTAR